MLRARVLSILLVFILLYGGAASAADSRTAVYDIDFLPEEYQTFRGFGINQEVAAINFITWQHGTEYDASFSTLTRDLGVTIVRAQGFGFWTADGKVDRAGIDRIYNGYIKRFVVEGGLQWYYTSIIMPVMCKTDSRGWKSLKEEWEEPYAQGLVDGLLYMKEKGYPLPIGLSIQNEPNDGHNYIPKEQYIRVFKNTSRKMKAAGLDNVMMVGPDEASLAQINAHLGPAFEELDKDPEFAQGLDAISYHSYTQNIESSVQQAENFIAGRKKYPDKIYWESEVSTLSMNGVAGEGLANYQMGSGVMIMQTLAADFAQFGVNYWMYHGGFDDSHIYWENGDSYVLGSKQMLAMSSDGWGTDGNSNTLKSAVYRMLKALFNQVRPGAKVHHLTSTDEHLVTSPNLHNDMVGFSSPGKQVALITNDRMEDMYYNLNGLKYNAATIYAVASENWRQTQVSYRNVKNGTIAELRIPAGSAVIVSVTDEDNASPKLTLAFDPKEVFEEDGQYYSRNEKVTVAGQSDEEAIVRNGGKIISTEDGLAFRDEVSLKRGEADYQLSTVDKRGNSGSFSFALNYDPNYVGVRPDELSVSTMKKEVVITGRTNAAGTVEWKDQSVPVNKEDYTFSLPVSLEEGDNEIVLTAKDEQGNESKPIACHYFCDSVSPNISVAGQKTVTTNDPYYLLYGSLNEKCASLTVNGQNAYMYNDLSFDKICKLNEGENVLTIQAKDPMGNSAEETVQVVYTKDDDTPHKTGSHMYVRKTTGQVVLDGDLNEKDWKMDIIVNKTVEGKDNNIVRMGVLWDEKNMYVGVRVQDTRFKYDTVNPFTNDCVELFLNPTNSKAGAYSGADRQIWSAYINNDLKKLYQNKYPVDSRWKFTDDGYDVEIAVPWQSIGLKAAENLEVGFDVAFNDNDFGGGDNIPRQCVLTWQGESNNYANTAAFGTLVLSPAGLFKYEDATESGSSSESGSDTTVEYPAITVIYNGKTVDYPTKAVVDGANPLVPVGMLEKMVGAEVSWAIGEELVITYKNGDVTRTHRDVPEMMFNGKEERLTHYTRLLADKETYLPMDYLQRFAGLAAAYDINTRTLTLSDR